MPKAKFKTNSSLDIKFGNLNLELAFIVGRLAIGEEIIKIVFVLPLQWLWPLFMFLQCRVEKQNKDGGVLQSMAI